MKKIWKDRWHWYARAIMLLLWSPLFLIIFPILRKWDSFLLTTLSNKLSFVLLVVIFLFGVVSISTHKLSYVTKEGVHVGNVTRDDHMEKVMKRLRIFVPWNDIKKLRIIKKKCQRSLGIRDFVSTLQVIPKKGKIMECYINDISGFTQALKSVGKAALLTSDSYTGPSATRIPLKDLFSSKYSKLLFRIIVGALIFGLIWFILRLVFRI